MKRVNFAASTGKLLCLLSMFTGMFFVSCDDDKNLNEPEPPPQGYIFSVNYFDYPVSGEHKDSIVSAESHELTFRTRPKPHRYDYDWENTEIGLAVWDYEAIEGYGPKDGNAGAWTDYRWLAVSKGQTVSNDWCSCELVIDGDDYWVNVSLMPNNTGKERAMKFVLSSERNESCTQETHLFVTQKPVIDATPTDDFLNIRP
ncbi:MAG: hypothetical protein K2K26_09025 [Muribaculaceae bacterium]|nr:hypothetical protein [Muribaculaceae bacterium]